MSQMTFRCHSDTEDPLFSVINRQQRRARKSRLVRTRTKTGQDRQKKTRHDSESTNVSIHTYCTLFLPINTLFVSLLSIPMWKFLSTQLMPAPPSPPPSQDRTLHHRTPARQTKLQCIKIN